MSLVSRLVPAAVFLAAALLALPAGAQETGTAAWLIKGQSLYGGPGQAYDVVGELGDEARIRVDRCTSRWCSIHAGGERGWAARDNISFGQEPRGRLTGPRLDHPRGGVACFFEGPDYSGASVCATAGTVVRDLLLLDLDNRYSSVEVSGSSVMVCRDRDFSSYCELILESQPRMHGFLDDNVSSYRVY